MSKEVQGTLYPWLYGIILMAFSFFLLFFQYGIIWNKFVNYGFIHCVLSLQFIHFLSMFTDHSDTSTNVTLKTSFPGILNDPPLFPLSGKGLVCMELQVQRQITAENDQTLWLYSVWVHWWLRWFFFRLEEQCVSACYGD